MQLKMKTNSNWLCSDRELLLRSKLEAGWSVKSSNFRTTASNSFRQEMTEKSNSMNQISDLEQEMIVDVLQRKQKTDQTEQIRVNGMFEKLKTMKRNAKGDGDQCCVLCGEQFSFFKNPYKICNDCKKYICSKCSVTNYSISKKKLILCKLCSETRENNIQKSNTNELEADNLHRRSSDQAYYDIINDRPEFTELSPSKEKSNFLAPPCQPETINRHVKRNSPNIGDHQTTIMLNDQIIEHTADDQMKKSTQSTGQGLRQILGKSLEQKLKQSKEHTQQQPDLFRSKEEERLRELHNDEQKFFVDDYLMTLGKVQQTKFEINRSNDEKVDSCYKNSANCLPSSNLNYKSSDMRSNHSNFIEKIHSSGDAGNQTNYHVNQQNNKLSSQTCNQTNDAGSQQTQQSIRTDHGGFNIFSTNAGSHSISDQIGYSFNKFINMIASHMNLNINQNIKLMTNNQSMKSMTHYRDMKNSIVDNQNTTNAMINDQNLNSNAKNQNQNQISSQYSPSIAYCNKPNPTLTFYDSNNSFTGMQNTGQSTNTRHNIPTDTFKSPVNQITNSPYSTNTNRRAHSPVYNSNYSTERPINQNQIYQSSLQFTESPVYQSNTTEIGSSSRVYQSNLSAQMTHLFYASNESNVNGANGRQSDQLNDKLFYYSQPTTPSSPMLSNQHTSNIPQSMMANNLTSCQNGQFVLGQNSIQEQIYQLTQANQMTYLQAKHAAPGNQTAQTYQTRTNLVRSLCSPVHNNHFLNRNLQAKPLNCPKLSSPNLYNNLENNQPISPMNQTNLMVSGRTTNNFIDPNHLMVNKFGENKYLN